MLKFLLISIIKLYKVALSPYLQPSCRFMPTCSSYAMEALETHGAIKGSWMAFKRVMRCHPFNKGGYDPVPPKHSKENLKIL